MGQQSFFVGFFVLLTITAVSFLGVRDILSASHPSQLVTAKPLTPQPSVAEKFQTYIAPPLPEKREYSIVMVGDSMTYALGPHGGKFYEAINEGRYKPLGKGILIDNYAAGSTNILSIQKAMTTKTTYWDATFEPLLSRQFDVILIESFGYNPLSQYGVTEGLKKQTETLDKTMQTIISTHPASRVVFVATIAPNKTKYALPINQNTTLAERTNMVEEREAYIKNHIAYAKEHNIPIINIYEKSLTLLGDGNLDYINPDDYIHPSAVGVEFIGEELAKYIFDNQIIPHQ
jgi:lysophospholipase L1-like esterase